MADTLSADLSGIQDFAGRLSGLRTDLDSYGSAVSAVGGDGPPDVEDGLQTFMTAENHARTVIDTYLQALQKMALQCVATIQAEEAELAKNVPHHRQYAD
jgi:hypothetical protein